MKRLQKVAFSLLGAGLFTIVLYSCSGDDQTATKTEQAVVETEQAARGAKENVDLKKLGLAIAQDEDFIKLYKNLEYFSEFKSDRVLKNELLKKEKLDEAEKNILAQAIGFESAEAAFKFETENFTYIKTITKKYDLVVIDQPDLQFVFDTALENTTTGRTCEEKLSTCKTGSWSLYVVEGAGCVAAGVGIGAGSWWCAGCLGAVVAVSCYSAATLHLDSMLETCADNYDDCKGK